MQDEIEHLEGHWVEVKVKCLKILFQLLHDSTPMMAKVNWMSKPYEDQIEGKIYFCLYLL